jgi:hypothetical protein
LFDLVRNAPPTLKHEPGLIVAEGDFVILHGRFSGMGLPVNWIVADILRIDNGILVEHWDVIQDEATEERSKSKAPMFGSSFPPHRRECVAKLFALEAHSGLNGPEKHSQGEPNSIAHELH